MNAAEILLTSKLLKAAAAEFGRHGCNDYTLPNTRENVDLLNTMERANVGPGRQPEEVHVFDARKKELYTYDWALMSFLSRKLEEIAMGKGNRDKDPKKMLGDLAKPKPATMPADPPNLLGPKATTEELVDDAASIRRITELNDQVFDLVAQNDKLVEENAVLTARAIVVEGTLAERLKHEAVTPNLDVQKYETRIAELMLGLRMWLRDHPNQFLRELRQKPDDGSALMRTVYLVLNADGTLRGVE